MSKKYESLAKEIIKKIGGQENISNARHCQTRLRFTLVDEKIVDDTVVENIEGVAKVIRNAGVYQVVIGTHVADVFEEVEKLIDLNSGSETNTKSTERKNPVEVVIDFVASVFQPVIPALSGAGMIKALLALLVVLNVITNDSQTYYLLNLFADGVFYFLPFILAFTTAQKMKCNPILAVSVAAMMLHPNWLALVTAGEVVRFFDIIPFTLTSYASSVIPIIFVIFVQSYIEKAIKKLIPKAVELVFVPMLTLLIMGILAFSVLGPLGAILGGYLATFFTFLSETASWAPAVLVGGFLPLMVMFGLHNGVAPLGVMQMSNLGYDSIFGPGCVCSNMAQATAGAIVAFRTKDKKTRQIATSGSITAYMGITEPLLYGVSLPKKYPLVATMIGGACGGMYAGITHTHKFATGSSGLPVILLYLGDDTIQYFVNIIIAIIISIVVTGILTLILSFKFERKEEAEETKIEEKKTIKLGSIVEITAPLKGEVLELSNAKDEAFASGALGKGVVIMPKEGVVVAPFDATVVALFPTNHAIGLLSESGAQLMIHVGIDTVELNGKCFKALVNQGDKVKAGQRLIEFDIDGIKAVGYSEQTMVIVTNSEEYSKIDTKTNLVSNGTENVISVRK